MYGSAAKWSHEAATPTSDFDAGPYAARLAAATWARSQDAPAGPVHVNCPFRESLAPVDLPAESELTTVAPVHLGTVAPDPAALHMIARQISGQKVLLVVGELPTDAARPVIDLAAALDAPIFADPLSNLRAGDHNLSRVIATGDTLARAGLLFERLAPDLVIRFGAPATSKALSLALARASLPPPVRRR